MNEQSVRDHSRDQKIVKWIKARKPHADLYRQLGISRQRFYILLNRLREEGKI